MTYQQTFGIGSARVRRAVAIGSAVLCVLLLPRVSSAATLTWTIDVPSESAARDYSYEAGVDGGRLEPLVGVACDAGLTPRACAAYLPTVPQTLALRAVWLPGGTARYEGPTTTWTVEQAATPLTCPGGVLVTVVAGQATATCAMTQPPPPTGLPVIDSLTVAPASIGPGETARLTWVLSGTAPTSLRIDPGIGGVGTNTRNRTVAPTQTTTYTLTATTAAGSVTRTVTLAVATAPPPVPVDCVGTWGAWTRVAGSETACAGGSRTYQEQRLYTVVTSPANGGLACPASPEGRASTESCTVTPPPPVPAPDLATVQATTLKFAETWARNWNFEGHAVDSRFDGNYGNWDYTETTYEPWLFDRATVGHRLFELTGDTRWRQRFLDDFAWYRQRIGSDGTFSPRPGDTKYGYVTPFVLYERLTGDAQYRPVARRIYDSWVREWPTTFSPTSAQLWTEREMAFALEAVVAWHELTQDAAVLPRAQALLDQWDVVAGAAGAPQVSYTRHEGGGPGGTTPTNLVNSPWMSALYFQATRRLAVAAPSMTSQIHRQVTRYADWLEVHGYYDGTLAHPENRPCDTCPGYTVPRYLTGELIGDAGYDSGNMDHALDVAGVVAFAVVAKRAQGADPAPLVARRAALLATAAWAYQGWTRSTTYLPKYRLSPPRKANWLIRGLAELVALGQ